MREKELHLAYDITIIAKGLHALIEVVGGILLYFVSRGTIVHALLSLTTEELAEDPKDIIAHFLVQYAHSFSISSEHFAAFYLLSHGIINAIIVVGLFKEKIWAYHVSIIVFGGFVLYQLYRFTFTHSWWLLFLSVLDILIIGLTWHEFTYQKTKWK